jgi:hypothetical protein
MDLRITVDDDKIRRYRSDDNINPPNTVSFKTSIPSTSGRLHSEFVRLLFLQTHRETDLFFDLQEFIFLKPTVDYSTSAVCLSINSSKTGLSLLSR